MSAPANTDRVHIAVSLRLVAADFAVRTIALMPVVEICQVPLEWAPRERLAISSRDLAMAPRGVATVTLSSPRLRTASYRFPEALADTQIDNHGRSSSSAPRGGRPHSTDQRDLVPRPLSVTRIRPPADIIKLEDRLFYVLQPPLQAWMRSQSLTMPSEPFAYQYDGIAFLYPRVSAVLADEMGLGKTMQAITALRLLLRTGEIRSALVVCPKPLVPNWRRELSRWAPEIPCLVIEGSGPKRAWQWRFAGAPLKIANYELLVRDGPLVHDAAHFDLVVLDEAQRIKNRRCATSHAVRGLSRDRSWALTGTPVENGADDLVGIFEFIAPGYLSPQMKLRRIARAASDHVLRRTKNQVLADLPPKLLHDAQLELTPPQRETYRLAEDEGVLRLTQMGDRATIHHVFELVLRLKQICNVDPATGSSAKLDRLAADLEEVAASGQKAIVFSQWVTTLEWLAKRLARFQPLALNGKIPPRQREETVGRFRDERGRNLLLISYGAGGVGLNLQCASYVFLFDRWWNPAVEDQAINRAHRIGTKSTVTVTRFFMLETIEERIEQILSEKRAVFDTIFSHLASRPTLSLSREEIFGLFALRCPSTTGGAAA